MWPTEKHICRFLVLDKGDRQHTINELTNIPEVWELIYQVYIALYRATCYLPPSGKPETSESFPATWLKMLIYGSVMGQPTDSTVLPSHPCMCSIYPPWNEASELEHLKAWMVGRQAFPFGKPYFQVRTVNFREGISGGPNGCFPHSRLASGVEKIPSSAAPSGNISQCSVSGVPSQAQTYVWWRKCGGRYVDSSLKYKRTPELPQKWKDILLTNHCSETMCELSGAQFHKDHVVSISEIWMIRYVNDI